MMDKNFTPFPVLKTERLILRQLVSSDDKELFVLRSDSNVNKYLDRKASESIDDAKNFIQAINESIQKNDSIYWVITWGSNNKLLGTVCLFSFSDDNFKAEIGYELLTEFQGKGIMQEAISVVIDFGFQDIGLNSIDACTHAKNKNSVKLLEKFNFKKYSVSNNNLILFKLTFTSERAA
jgi:ribosomal-protein-alanine N-acetyltransferase